MTKFQEVHLRAALKRDQMKPAYRNATELAVPEEPVRGRPRREESLEQEEKNDE
jgi:hypothetical protein